MARFRFTLLALLGIVTSVGVGLAAIVNAWATGVVSCTLAVIAFGALVAFHGRGERRVFWSSFTALAVAYLAIIAGLQCYAEATYGWYGEYLATERLSQWMRERTLEPYTEAWQSAEIVSPFFWAVILGLVGGLAGRWISRRGSAEKTDVPK